MKISEIKIMINEEIEKFGNIYYHGSNNKFETFDNRNNKTYREFDIPSWFFTKDIDYAKSYGKYLYSVKLNISNTFDLTNKKHYNIFLKTLKELNLSKEEIEETLDEQMHMGLPYWTNGNAFYCAISNGFDSILIQEELEREVLSIAVFNNEDIDIMGIQ